MHGRPGKPANVSLNDVMNYIENTNQRELKIIYSLINEKQKNNIAWIFS
jgi:hypothetical protein